MAELTFAASPEERTAPGWQGRLAVRLQPENGRTRLRRLGSFGPIYVQKPFYPEGTTPHVYLLHPPGGVVAGDRLDIDLDVARGASALVTTPAATRFYASTGLPATLTQTLRVAADGCLEWLPQETIFFRGCRAIVATTVLLDANARYLGWDISCLGRPAAGDHFQAGSAESRVALFRVECDGTTHVPLILERNLWRAGAVEVNERWGLAGYAVAGVLYATPADDDLLALLRARLASGPREPHGIAALTVMENVLVARVLARHGEVARGWLTRVWEQVRPVLLGRAPCPPRIWNT